MESVENPEEVVGAVVEVETEGKEVEVVKMEETEVVGMVKA